MDAPLALAGDAAPTLISRDAHEKTYSRLIPLSTRERCFRIAFINIHKAVCASDWRPKENS